MSPRNALFVWQPLSVTGGVESFVANCMKLLPVEYGIQPYVLQVGPMSGPLLSDFDQYSRYLLQIDQSCWLTDGTWPGGPAKLLADLSIDVVVFNDWVFSELVEPFSAHAPVTMTCNSHQPYGIYYSLASRYSKHLDAIIGVSEVITATLRAHLGPDLHGMVHLIRNGIEIPGTWRRQRAQNGGRIKLIYLGRLEQEYKRVFDLVDLAVELDRLPVPADILLVGDGPDRPFLETRLAETHLEHVTVRFHGHLRHAEALEVLDTCDIVLLVSDTEGLPLCLLEAAARGVVPVVTRLPNGIEDYFADGVDAYMFQPGDTAFAAQLIGRLHHDRQTLSRAASSARKVAENFDLHVSLSAFAKLLEEISMGAAKRRVPAAAEPSTSGPEEISI